MSEIIDIIENLKAEGEFDSIGRFTLDRKKAKEKMQKYQLIDPHYYVLEIIQSAIAGGATHIDIYIDSDDCIIEFDGEPFSKEDLENIYSSLFVARSDMSLERFRELAIGINSAQALNPRFITVMSGDGKSGVMFKYQPPEEETVTICEKPIQGTRIHVKDRISWRVASRFFSRTLGINPPTESKIIREKCIYAHIPIYINKEIVNSKEKRVIADTLCQVEFKNGIRGIIGIPNAPQELSQINIMKFGVMITGHSRKISSIAIKGAVESNNLIKNASQSDVIEDDAYKKMLEGIVLHLDDLISKLADIYKDADTSFDYQKKVIANNYIMDYVERKFRVATYGENSPEALKKVASLELLETTEKKTVSLDFLAQQFKRLGFLPFARKYFNQPHPEGWEVVYLPDEKKSNFLNKLFSSKLRNAEMDFFKVLVREKNIRQWHESKQPMSLMASGIGRVKLEGEQITADLGILSRYPDDYSRIKFFKENGPIVEKALMIDGLSFDGQVNNDLFEPVYTWDDIIPDENLAKTLEAILEYIPRLYVQVAEWIEKEGQLRGESYDFACLHLLRYINFVLGGKEKNKTDKADEKDKSDKGDKTDKTDKADEKDKSDKGDKTDKTDKKDEKDKTDQSHSMQIPVHILETLTAGKVKLGGKPVEILIHRPHLKVPDRWLDLKLFRNMQNMYISFNDIQKSYKKYLKVYFINKEMPGEQLDDRLIVFSRDIEESVLKRFFGAHAVENYEKGLLDERIIIKNLNKPQEQPVIKENTLEKVYFESEEEEIEGEVGLLAFEDKTAYAYRYDQGRPAPSNRVKVRLLKHFRFISFVELDFPLKSATASVNYNRITVNNSWNGVIEDDKFQIMKEALIKGFRNLGEKILSKYDGYYQETHPKLRLFLLQLVGVLSGPRDPKKPVEYEDPLLTLLMDFPLLTTTEEILVSLKQMEEQKNRIGFIPFITQKMQDSFPDDRKVLILSPSEQTILRNMWGRDKVVNVEEEMKQKMIHRIIKDTRPVLSTKLLAGATLLSLEINKESVKGEIGIMKQYFPSASQFSNIKFLKEYRWIMDKLLPLKIGVMGIINNDNFKVNPKWTAIEEDEEYKKVQTIIQESLFELIQQLLDKYSKGELDESDKQEAIKQFLGFITGSFETYQEVKRIKPHSVIHTLANLPILPALGGKNVSYMEILEGYIKNSSISFVYKASDDYVSDLGFPIIIFDKETKHLLNRHFLHFYDYTQDLNLLKIARENMKKPPLKSLEIEKEYLIKTPIVSQKYQGELALPEDINSTGGIIFAKNRIPVVEKLLYPRSKVFGIVNNNEFQTNKTFDDVNLFTADRRLLLTTIYKLYERLAKNYPDIQEPAKKEVARRLLMDFYYEQKNFIDTNLKTMDQKLESRITSLALIPLHDNRPTSIDVLFNTINRIGYLPFITPEQNRQEESFSEEILLLLTVNDFDYEFCFRVFGPRVMKNYIDILKKKKFALKQEEMKKKETPTPRQIPVQEAKIPVQEIGVIVKEITIPPVKADEKLPPIKESPPPAMEVLTPDMKLLHGIRREFRLIRERGDYKLSDKILDSIRCAKLPSSPPVIFDGGKSLLTLNISHPLTERIIMNQDKSAVYLYYMLSIIYSTINRELLEVTDEDEMAFQMIMVENLNLYPGLK